LAVTLSGKCDALKVLVFQRIFATMTMTGQWWARADASQCLLMVRWRAPVSKNYFILRR